MLAIAPELVRDIFPGASGGSIDSLININGTLYFAANDGIAGTELWKSDGTSNGTVLVRDINVGPDGSSIQNVANINGTLFFRAYDPDHGWDLWKSDGTSSGTTSLDVRPGSAGSNPSYLTNVNGQLYFSAFTDVGFGYELWRSDGTESGTTIVADLEPSNGSGSVPRFLTNVNGVLYFQARDSFNGVGLWRTDSTFGATLVYKFNNVSTGHHPLNTLANVNGKLFFRANDGIHGPELWTTDGTSSGTVMVRDIFADAPQPYANGSFPSQFVNLNGIAYFTAQDGVHGEELWRSDGTSLGTFLVQDVNPGTAGSYPNNLTVNDSRLFFSGRDDLVSGTELRVFDSLTSATALVRDVRLDQTGADIRYISEANGNVYFVAVDGDLFTSPHGQELWESDGTSSGTSLVADLNIGPANAYVKSLTNVNGTLFFIADDGIHGSELWKLAADENDGTPVNAIPGSQATSEDVALTLSSGGSNGISISYSGPTPATTTANVSVTHGIVTLSGIAGLTVTGNGSSSLQATGTLNALNAALDGLQFTPTPGYHGTAALTIVSNDGSGAIDTDTVALSIVAVNDPPQVNLGELRIFEMVADIRPGVAGSFPRFLFNLDGVIYFEANDGVHGKELWKSDGTSSGTVLVADIIPGSGASYPLFYENLNGTVYFRARDITHGYELWKTDGTSGGTLLVAEINPGTAHSEPRSLINVGGTIYFLATDAAHGRELWRTNGTSTGTSLVADVNPGASSSTQLLDNLAAVNGFVYFAANTGTSGTELWKSDGTSAGTTRVIDLFAGSGSSNPRYLTTVGGELFFTAEDDVHGSGLWKSDGTESGTVRVSDVAISGHYGLSGKPTANVNGILYFSGNGDTHGNELWKSDGTSSGTVLVHDIDFGASSSDPGWMLNFNGTLYFRGSDPVHGNEIWKSDGTSSGTVIVKDQPGNYLIRYLTDVGGTIYFHNSAQNGSELWKFSSTTLSEFVVDEHMPLSGFGLSVTDVDATESSGVVQVTLSAMHGLLTLDTSDLTFSAGDGSNDSSMTFTGNVIDVNQALTSLVYQVDLNFSGTDSLSITVNDLGNTGTGGALTDTDTVAITVNAVNDAPQIAIATPTAPRTVLVRDINPGSADSNDPGFSVNVNGIAYFYANDETHGSELWKSDGTDAGTVLVRDINPGAGSSNGMYSELTNVNGTLFFKAFDPVGGQRLWKSDGTSNGTQPVIAQAGLTPDMLTNVNGTLFFRAFLADHLWKSDGTSTGTVEVKEFFPGGASAGMFGFTSVNNTLFFSTFQSDSGYELWKSDGTASGTVLVKDIRPGTSPDAANRPFELTNVNGTLYFRANDGTTGFELWKSDGTSSGTTLVKDIYPGPLFGGPSDGPSDLTNVNGTLYFFAQQPGSGIELWKSDGTSAGTVMVKDIATGTGSSYPSRLANVGGTLYFWARDSLVGGYDIWRSNGTSSGTVMVKDFLPPLQPTVLTNVNDVLYFRGRTAAEGYELWQTDGTSAGTVLVQDIYPGVNSSNAGGPTSMSNIGGALFFLANDGTHGYELWTTAQVHVATAVEDISTAVTGISISDVDAGSATVSVSLTVLQGTLTLSTSVIGGITAGQISGNGTTTVTLTAPLATINATLAANSGLVYLGSAEYNGSDALTISANDLGNTGGGPLLDTDTIYLTVTEVNDAPLGADDSLSGIAEDSGNYTIAFATLLSNDTTGPTNENGQTLMIMSVDSAVGGTVSIVGSDVVFTPTQHFNGAASFVYTLRDNGTTNGVNDFLTSTATARFTITAVNDTPINNVPAARTVNEDISQALTGLSISDVDSGTAPITVSLSVTSGTLNVRTNSGGGVTEGAISGNGSASVTITAPRGAINATLASVSGLMYLGDFNFNGSAMLTVTTNDLGNTGAGGALTDSDNVAISITEVNDAPIGVNDSLSAIAEDSGNRVISFASLLGNDSTGPANESSQTLTITNVGSAVGGTVSISGTNVIFSPALNFNGPASFVYTLHDNGTTAGVNDFKTATATAGFTITEVNDAPNAVTNVIPYYIGPGTRTIAQSLLLSNDTPGPANESSQTLTFGTVGSPLPSGATVVVSGSNVLYTPPLGYSGPASFTYTVTDNGTTNGLPDPLTSAGTASLFFLFPGVALPAVDLNGPTANFSNTVTYTENTPAVVIPTATATLTDFDSTYLLSVTATLLATPDGASEALSAVTAGTSITASYNPTTRVLTLMGPDSAVNFQQVLRTVAYKNTSEAPTVLPARTVRFVTSDGGNLSVARDATVNIVAVNDAPSTTGTTTALAYTENDGPTVIFPDVTTNDLDSFYFVGGVNTVGLTRATIGISPYIAGQDFLSYTNAGISGSFNTTTGVFTLNGTATLTQYNNAIRLITYRNTSDNPSTTPRVFTLTVFDSTAPSDTLLRTLNITSVNDAPTADLNGPAGGGNNFTTTYRTSVGTIPIVYSTSTVTDLDNATMTSLTVTITNVQNAGNEVLTYTLPGGISASAPSNTASTVVFTGIATPATYQTLLRSIQYRNLAASPTLGSPRAIIVVTNDGSATLTSTTTVTLVSPLQAASDPLRLASDRLSAAQLTPIVQAAIEHWSAKGLSLDQIAKLHSTSYVVADIGVARWLGQAASGNVVTIDDNAAGFGWFVDLTPRDDREFTQIVSSSQRTAPGMTRMDLLTVVMHEMGHILGLPDVEDDTATGVMTEAITAGTRRVSTVDDLQALAFYLNQNSNTSPAALRDTEAVRSDVFARWS